LELKDSGYYDETNVPSKNIITLCARNAFYNIRNLNLPHYSYVYKYSKPNGDTTGYYEMLKFMDEIISKMDERIPCCSDVLEKKRLEHIKYYVKKTRYIYDKFDDISRPVYPIWQKRLYLSNIKDALEADNYDELDNFMPLPLYAFKRID
jgi:hypothetical protein